MDLICPLCNGLIEYHVVCEECGSDMTDAGALVNYLDNYSPYLSNDITQQVDGASYDKCVHLFQCDVCNKDKRVTIKRVRR